MADTVVSFKVMLEACKLYLSSLFARKAQYVIIGYKPNVWIFTNIEPERLAIYSPETDDVLHFVTFSPEATAFQLINSQFPVLTEGLFQIKADEFLAGLKPCTGIPRLIVNKQSLFLQDPPAGTELLCGRCLSDYDIQYYEALFNHYSTNNHKPEFCDSINVTPEQMAKSAIIYIALPLFGINIPLVDGHSNPSLVEYVKRSKLTCTFLVEYWIYGRAAFATTVFTNDELTVKSVRPNMRWFTKRDDTRFL